MPSASSAQRPGRLLPVGLLLSAALLVVDPMLAHAAKRGEIAFAQMVNEHRVTLLLPPLALSERLSDLARRHSGRMAERGVVYHSSLVGKLNAVTVAENVGSGDTLPQLLRGFLASPEHTTNILGPYTRTGVGIVRADGRRWLTQIFVS